MLWKLRKDIKNDCLIKLSYLLMRLKSELYGKEQNELVGEIIDILSLDKYNSITLHELDNDIGHLKNNYNFPCI